MSATRAAEAGAGRCRWARRLLAAALLLDCAWGSALRLPVHRKVLPDDARAGRGKEVTDKRAVELSSVWPEVLPLRSKEYVSMVEIGLGTPAQKLVVAADMGSANLWVMDERCQNCDSPEVKHVKFRRRTSESYRDLRGETSVSYNFAWMKGSWAQEVLQVGSVSLFVPVALASEVPPPLDLIASSGILGLGFDIDSRVKASVHPGFLELLARSHVGSTFEPVFSFVWKGRGLEDDGELVVGELQREHYAGGIIWLPVLPTILDDDNLPVYGYWRVALDGARFDSPQARALQLNPAGAMVDSGTACVGVPQGDYQLIVDWLATAQRGGVVPDDIMLTVTLGGREFSLSLETLCVVDLGDFPLWILGDVFHRSHHVTYDFGSQPPQLGLPIKGSKENLRGRHRWFFFVDKGFLAVVGVPLFLMYLALLCRLRSRRSDSKTFFAKAFGARHEQLVGGMAAGRTVTPAPAVVVQMANFVLPADGAVADEAATPQFLTGA